MHTADIDAMLDVQNKTRDLASTIRQSAAWHDRDPKAREEMQKWAQMVDGLANAFSAYIDING